MAEYLLDVEKSNDQSTGSTRESGSAIQASWNWNRTPEIHLCKQCKPSKDKAFLSARLWRIARSTQPAFPVFVSTTASVTSLYTAMFIWNRMMTGTGTRCNRTVGKLLPKDQRNSSPIATKPSIEVFVIIIHIYALATMTLHRSRRRDRYQNAMVVVYTLVGMCGYLYGCPGLSYQENLILVVASLPVVIATALSLSAVIHGGLRLWERRRAIRLYVGKIYELKDEGGRPPPLRAAGNAQKTIF